MLSMLALFQFGNRYKSVTSTKLPVQIMLKLIEYLLCSLFDEEDDEEDDFTITIFPHLHQMLMCVTKKTISMVVNGCKRIDIGILKLFLLVHVGNIVIVSETEQGLQLGLDVLSKYCEKWKLVVNVNKIKNMVFRKHVRLK